MALGNEYKTSGTTKNTETQDREHEKALYAKRYIQIETNQQGRWEYNADSTILYAGYAPKGLTEGTDGWLLQKFTYTSMRPTKREIGYGNWTNRASESFS